MEDLKENAKVRGKNPRPTLMTSRTRNQPLPKTMKTLLPSLLASLLLSSSAHAGWLTVPAKVAGKIAKHGADNVVEHVVTHSADNVVEHVVTGSADNVAEHVATHNADDAAKAIARGGAKASLKSAPAIAKTIDASVDAARLEAHAMKPAVASIHRPPIPKPRNPTAEAAIKAAPLIAVGAGTGVGIARGADNLSAGSRDRSRSIGEAERTAIQENPSLLPQKWEAENRPWTILAWCGGGSVLLIGAGIGIGLLGFLGGRRLLAGRRFSR